MGTAKNNAAYRFAEMPEVDGAMIVESGSNSDGEWTRWADGTQQCFSQVAPSAMSFIAGGSLYRSAFNLTYIAPIAFLGNPIKTGSISDGAGVYATVMGIKFVKDTGIYELWASKSLTDVSPTHTIFAAGRWK